jgi:hypothetical protein
MGMSPTAERKALTHPKINPKKYKHNVIGRNFIRRCCGKLLQKKILAVHTVVRHYVADEHPIVECYLTI